jgi:ribonuclease PH
MVLRIDGRPFDAIRTVRITPGYMPYAEGSAYIELGNTKVIAAASVDERVPAFLRGQGGGWMTAEYAMLPRATVTRSAREVTLGRVQGRSQEIQRLIGRSLRAAVDLRGLGERTVVVDCDVVQADGGTRTASVTAGYVAVVQALRTLAGRGVIPTVPVKWAVAAVSVGIAGGKPLLDLCYEEDCRADVDFNVVMTERGEFVEIQGTAESRPFSRAAMDTMLELAENGIRDLFEAQRAALRQMRS